jgi:RNA polymerase sigma-70 factor (ECF subfamily)
MTDAELVARVKLGDANAFRDLVSRYYANCWRYARAQLGHDADAEDIIQETLWSAYVALDQYKEEGRFRQWLFSILINKVRNFQVARSRRDHRFPALDSIESLDLIEPIETPTITPPDEDVDMSRVIAQLEPILREAVLLKHAEELEYREIAALTGVGESALKMRVKRGLEQLRVMLGASSGRDHDRR